MRRTALLIVFLLRIGSMGAFIFSGVLAAKELGPDIMSAIKAAMERHSADPLVLARRAQQDQKDFYKRKGKKGFKNDDLGFDSASGKDDPYQYVKGGEKSKEGSDKAKAGDAGKDQKEIDLNPKNALAGAGSGRQGLWDKSKLGSGSFDGVSKLGESGGAGGPGAGGPAQSAQNIERQLSSVRNIGSAAGGGGSGRTARTGVHGIRKGAAFQRNTGGSGLDQLKGAVGTARRADGGGFQDSGYIGAAYGEGKNTKQLQMPGGGEIGEITGDFNDTTMPDADPNKPSELKPNLDESQAEAVKDYDAMEIAINVIALAAAVLGGILAVTLAMKENPFSTGVWWGLYAALGALLGIVSIMVASLMGSDDVTGQSLGQAYLALNLTLAAGLIMLVIPGIGAGAAGASFLGTAVQSVARMASLGKDKPQ